MTEVRGGGTIACGPQKKLIPRVPYPPSCIYPCKSIPLRLQNKNVCPSQKWYSTELAPWLGSPYTYFQIP